MSHNLLVDFRTGQGKERNDREKADTHRLHQDLETKKKFSQVIKSTMLINLMIKTRSTVLYHILHNPK